MYDGQLAFLNEEPPNDDTKPDAYWLEDYYADVWVLKAGQEKIELSWDFVLPDGSKLVDLSNSILLEACRRTLFNLKNPYYTTRDVSCKRIKYYYHSIVCVAEWAILNNDLYNTKKYGFARLDSDAIRDLIRIFVNDGKDGLQGLIKRTQTGFEKLLADTSTMEYVSRKLHSIPKNIIRSDWVNLNLITFSIDESSKLRAWLYLNGFYHKVYTRSFTDIDNDSVAYVLNKNFLSAFIKTRNIQIGCKTRLFLRQFEMAEDFEKVDLAGRYETIEYLPSDYLSLEEKALIPATLGSSRHITDLLEVFRALSPYVKGLPDQKVLTSINFTKLAIHFGAGGDKHHRTTPPEIALKLIDLSIEYIIEYGDDIIDTYLDWKIIWREIEDKNKGIWNKPRSELKEECFKELVFPQRLRKLNIHKEISVWRNEVGFIRNEFGGHPCASISRTKMTLNDSVKLLFASTYCLIASFSARRRMELAELKCGCVKGSHGSYELEFYLRKSEFEGKRTKIRRPIPNIVARAIFLLEKLHKGLKQIYGKSNKAYLFSVPYNAQNYDNNKPSNKSIDLFVFHFCDYINLDTVEVNRRWYPKSHEFRRFFAIVFFWQFKFANLAAISWMLGHVETEHTYAYIKEIIGGKELTRVEAVYSAEAMLNSNRGADNEGSLNILRNIAMQHFQCEDIEVIEKSDLELYLEELLEEGVYKVRPHSFITAQNVKHKMVFEIALEGKLNEQ
ncbi:hypothetical protein PCIT_a3994 [Pseudoalteromonas citrea]|uniref:Uncharacterized protein n=2 Tax=Pseudoalteromonas citrea TaxID=43655 RepID=A0AAD4AIP8_9GAMM|nr:hypothetical protein [Pseudoalteromonas citrea]KAF7771420.1 hypothetical protein PCIT_a3994 [Pseudoalteromonas citrea]